MVEELLRRLRQNTVPGQTELLCEGVDSFEKIGIEGEDDFDCAHERGDRGHELDRKP